MKADILNNEYVCLQLTLLLGKRDYVDHVDTVDAVGEFLFMGPQF